MRINMSIFLSCVVWIVSNSLLLMANGPGCGLILHQPPYPKELLEEED